jgi:hypothetical protein
MPTIELLWWEGCPSHPAALEQLREELAALGHDPSAVTMLEVRNDEQARAERFIGSPTIRVDGQDLFDVGDEPTSLSCRVYRLRDGRFSPTPDRADLRATLERALPPAS